MLVGTVKQTRLRVQGVALRLADLHHGLGFAVAVRGLRTKKKRMNVSSMESTAAGFSHLVNYRRLMLYYAIFQIIKCSFFVKFQMVTLYLVQCTY